MSAKFIWIASYPKSGNTWLRAFLLHLFMDAQKQLPLNDVSEMAISDSLVRDYDAAAKEVRREWPERETAAKRAAVQKYLSDKYDVTKFAKTHSVFTPWHGHRMFDVSCIAGAICVVRNPLDVVASLSAATSTSIQDTIDMMNTSGFVWPATSLQVPQLIGSWSENVASWTGGDDPTLHTMRFEDMIEDPSKAFGELVRFLKVDPPPEQLARAIHLTSFENLRDIEKSSGFAEHTDDQSRFFRSGRAGGWRKELTAEQAQQIVDAHRDQMMRFGYVPEGM